MTKEKEIVFSKEIDSSITGFSVGVSFVVVAMFIWFGALLHNRTVETIVTIILLIIGICGTFLEIEKINHNNIKGLGDFCIGLVFVASSIFFIVKYDLLMVNIICLFVLLLGVYATFCGILKIGYSLKVQQRKTKNKKVEIFKIITGITELIALAVVILQLIAELG